MSRIADRLNKLRRRLAEEELKALFISQPENRYYLSGFTGSSGFLLITEQTATLATDFRYIEQAKVQSPDFEIFQIAGDMVGWISGLTADLHLSSLGFEAGHVTFAMHRQLRRVLNRRPSVRLIPSEGIVESLRVVKEPDEIALIARAAELGDNALVYIEDTIRPGMSEQQIAWELEKSLRDSGSQAIPFEIIVAAGPNAALPHARPSGHIISRGDTFNKIYDVVLDAQLSAVSIIREGVTAEQVDTTARAVIQNAGYGEAFGHALGHGIGLAPHELPRLGPGSVEILKENMVFSIEPGIYLPGWGGVRIEDLVVMKNGKAELISKARKV